MDSITRDEIMQIRASGRVNMLDAAGVKKLAGRLGFRELVLFIDERRSEYWHFIMFGE